MISLLLYFCVGLLSLSLSLSLSSLHVVEMLMRRCSCRGGYGYMDLVYRTESNVIHYRLSSPQRFVVVVALQRALWCGFFFVVSCFFEASPVTARATAAPSLLPFRADNLILLVGSIVDSTWFVQGKKLVRETFSGLGTN